jgi:hypothetical protein
MLRKEPHGRPRHNNNNNNIAVDRKEIGWSSMDLIGVAQDRDK